MENIIPIAHTRIISTHALTEGDKTRFRLSFLRSYFNSRPHGGRPNQPFRTEFRRSFQLTPSRRATRVVQWAYYQKLFQLTPSRRATLPASSTVILDYFNSRPHGGRLWGQDPEVLWSHFNSRPHGGRLSFLSFFRPSKAISTHALTEGDGKFRQIFLLNRGYAYSISLYFLPHFISLLPQILSFQQKSFKFQVRIFLLFSVHLAFALQNQCVHHVKYRFCTNMFYFVFVLFTQIVKPQTIGLFIYDFF